MLSSRAKYALRAAIHLADRAGDGDWVPTAQIAEQETIPRKFLEAILVELRTHGLLDSRRGPGGGHRLRLPARAIAVADIIRIVDGPLALAPCASRTQFRACDDCPDLETCRMRPLLARARDAVAAVLEDCTLADLATSGDATDTTRPGRKRAAAL
jgi:Rrf2 family protein